MVALLRSHAVYDGFYALECVVVDIDILDGFSYARYHRGEVFDVAHLLDLLYLRKEVVEVELILGDFL